MKHWTPRLSLVILLAAAAHSGEPEWWHTLGKPYSAAAPEPLEFKNSPRLEKLIRAGNLYLSLEDAIALAIENNLDVEVQRLNARLASTDVTRARGGGTTRGLNYSLAEAPAGVGGVTTALPTGTAAQRTVPGSSVSTNPFELGALGQVQTNLNLLSQAQLSSGTAVPSFDPVLSGRTNWQHLSTPQVSPFLSGQPNLVLETWNAGAGFRQGFSSGAQLGLNFDNLRQTTNSYRTSYSPYTSTALSLSLTQPLLRGFGLRVNRRYQRMADNQRQIADLLFRQQLVNTVYGVTRLYDDYVALHEDVKVKVETNKLAQKLFADTKALVDEGVLAAAELARAKAQVSSTRLDLEKSRGLLEEQQAILKTVLTQRGVEDPLVRQASLIPTTTLAIPDPDTRSEEELLSLAIQKRADLQQAEIQIRNIEISLEGTRNAVKPQADLVISAQNSGLAGEMNPLALNLDPTYIGGYGSALAQVLRRNYPTYAAGIQLDLPLRNRVAQADLARDQIQLRQGGIRLQQLRNQVRLEVEDALIALRRARAAHEAAVETRMFQEESLSAEQAKFEAGTTTSFFLIQFQNSLAQARSAEVAARGAVAKAQAALNRATGAILEQYGISLEAAKQGAM